MLNIKNEDLNNVMKNQCQHLTDKQHNDMQRLKKNSKSCSMEHLAHGKKIGCESNMLDTIPSTEGTRRNV